MSFKKIKTAILTALCFLLCFFSDVTGQSASDAYRVTTFTATENPAIDVRTSGGHIEVLGHSDEEIRVEMYVQRRNRYYSEGEADLSDYTIDIFEDGNTVKAHAERESSGWSWFGRGSDQYNISFRVLVPERTEVKGRTSGGRVTAENISNSVNLRTSGGRVAVKNIEGALNARTSGGSIDIEHVRGDVDARTSGGSVRVEAVDGNVELRTSGGSIRMDNIAGAISARTSGGSIRAEGIDPRGDMDFRTSGGSIRIELPKEKGYDFALRGNRVNIDLVNFSGRSDRGLVEGAMNGGGQKVEARTSGGSVTVRFRS